MKLTKVVESIIVEDSGASLRKRIVELERDKKVLQLAVDHSAEDYEMVVGGSRKLSSKCDQLKIRCKSLQAELAQAHSDVEKHVSDLEAKVKFAKDRGVEIATESEKNLGDFRRVLVEQLEKLHEMYTDKVQSIGSLSSAMSVKEHSVEDYLSSEEVTGLTDMFSGMNGNFATAVIEGALSLAGNSVDLEAVRVATSKGGTDVLPVASGVRKAAWAVSNKLWWSFGYDYVLSIIHAQ
jgi:DNA-binding MarR family transcriptional regulator